MGIECFSCSAHVHVTSITACTCKVKLHTRERSVQGTGFLAEKKKYFMRAES